MHNIALISTSHQEHGKCNSGELLIIFEKIKPDVIFEEMPALRFNDFYVTGTESSLGSKAIIAYSQNHTVEHVPVDNCIIPKIDMKKIDSVFRTIGRKNPEYASMTENNYTMTFQHGFRYLNSLECGNHFTKIKLLEMQTLLKLKDRKLLELYGQYYDIQNERVNAMLNEIYDYYKIHKFNNAVFLAGAAHRSFILQKIESMKSSDYGIKWLQQF